MSSNLVQTKTRRLVSALALATCLTLASSASAQASNAQTFVQNEQVRISTLLRQPANGPRDAQITQVLDTMVDYDELARRTMGQPCPQGEEQCVNHWAELTDEQKSEVSLLLRQLVQKNYRKNLIKTLDYDITYKGARDVGGDTRIRTEAKSKLQPRDPAVQVDYVVRGGGDHYRVVDIVTEGSSLTKNYYDQFHKMMTNPAQKYAYIAQKLREKIAKKD